MGLSVPCVVRSVCISCMKILQNLIDASDDRNDVTKYNRNMQRKMENIYIFIYSAK
uniref:Uncharacterized protein n=1 Tax=Ciona intestinalis TaxID=7719 RepID=H2XQ98_CIOIN